MGSRERKKKEGQTVSKQPSLTDSPDENKMLLMSLNQKMNVVTALVSKIDLECANFKMSRSVISK